MLASQLSKIDLKKCHIGMAIIETLLVLPILLLLILGIVQYAFIYTAKSGLDYATFMSARAGAVDHASKTSIISALSKSMVSLEGPEKNNDSLTASINKVRNEMEKFSHIKIINPTQEAFSDFAVRNRSHNGMEIPNEMLHIASTQIGQRSKVNIQDANILKIQVTYGYPLNIPFVNSIIIKAASLYMDDPVMQLLLKQNRLPILSSATVRMQSRAIYNDWVSTIAEVDNGVSNIAN